MNWWVGNISRAVQEGIDGSEEGLHTMTKTKTVGEEVGGVEAAGRGLTAREPRRERDKKRGRTRDENFRALSHRPS